MLSMAPHCRGRAPDSKRLICGLLMPAGRGSRPMAPFGAGAALVGAANPAGRCAAVAGKPAPTKNAGPGVRSGFRGIKGPASGRRPGDQRRHLGHAALARPGAGVRVDRRSLVSPHPQAQWPLADAVPAGAAQEWVSTLLKGVCHEKLNPHRKLVHAGPGGRPRAVDHRAGANHPRPGGVGAGADGSGPAQPDAGARAGAIGRCLGAEPVNEHIHIAVGHGQHDARAQGAAGGPKLRRPE